VPAQRRERIGRTTRLGSIKSRTRPAEKSVPWRQYLGDGIPRRTRSRRPRALRPAASAVGARLVSGGASQVVIEKLLPLQSLEPGQYTLRMKVVDKKRNQTLTPSATFTVT